MDETYAINLAKTEYQDAFNAGDVKRVLALISDGFTDMSVNRPSYWGLDAKIALEKELGLLFRRYRARMVAIVIAVEILGDTALDWGWHKLTLTPKKGGKKVTTRQRYLDVWKKDGKGRWKLAMFLSNRDVAPRI